MRFPRVNLGKSRSTQSWRVVNCTILVAQVDRSRAWWQLISSEAGGCPSSRPGYIETLVLKTGKEGCWRNSPANPAALLIEDIWNCLWRCFGWNQLIKWNQEPWELYQEFSTCYIKCLRPLKGTLRRRKRDGKPDLQQSGLFVDSHSRGQTPPESWKWSVRGKDGFQRFIVKVLRIQKCGGEASIHHPFYFMKLPKSI